MKFTLRIWRQKRPNEPGRLMTYHTNEARPEMSFLELLDLVSERLEEAGKEPIAFDHDCREGICGACGMMINGIAHGPMPATTVCQLYLRHFKDGDTITVEPWRAKTFSVIKDLVVDRRALDRIIQSGGYISVPAGSAPEANTHLVAKPLVEEVIDAASCIGCGACVAACPNASAMLFTAAKLSHLNLLPQGQPERARRALGMIKQMESEGFGSCTNHGECEAVCPKGISINFISRLNHEFLKK